MDPQLVNMQRIRAFGVLDCSGMSILHSSPQGSLWGVGQKECKNVRSMMVYIFNFSTQEADLYEFKASLVCKSWASQPPLLMSWQKYIYEPEGVGVDHFKEPAVFFHTQQGRCTFAL